MYGFSLGYVDLAPGNLLVWLIVAAIAGWVTGRIMGGGFGFIGDIVVGLIGAFVGNIIIGLFVTSFFGFWGTLIVAIIGSCLFTGLLRLFSRGAAIDVAPRPMASNRSFVEPRPNYPPPSPYQTTPRTVAPQQTRQPPLPLPPVAAPAVGTTTRVFVSHSHKDEAATMRLVGELQKGGASVWVDVADLQSDDFLRRINSALNATDWVVLVQSPHSLQSPAVEMEVNAALQLKLQGRLRGVIPFIITPTSRELVPALWSPLHYYDATTNYAAALQGLQRALGLAK